MCGFNYLFKFYFYISPREDKYYFSFDKIAQFDCCYLNFRLLMIVKTQYILIHCIIENDLLNKKKNTNFVYFFSLHTQLCSKFFFLYFLVLKVCKLWRHQSTSLIIKNSHFCCQEQPHYNQSLAITFIYLSFPWFYFFLNKSWQFFHHPVSLSS